MSKLGRIQMAVTGGALALSGCALSIEPPEGSPPTPIVLPAGSGSVTVRWVVAGAANPATCDAFGATDLELVVYDASGRPVTRQIAACGTFGLSIPLREGTYSAEVTLLDAAGNPVSTTKNLDAIEVISGTDLAIDVDFPAGSIR
jgi:hypothetical protein